MFPVAAVADQLGQQRIVVRGHGPAFVHAAVAPDSRARRRQQQRDPARAGEVVVIRVFGVDAAFHGMPAEAHILLAKRQRLARRDANLQMNQVETRDQFRHRMLHLQARIHFEEIEIFLLIHQKFHRAGVGVVRRLRHAHRNLAHPAPHLGVDNRRGRLFEHFLVPPLQRTLSLAQVQCVAMFVGQYLHLDVARVDDGLLNVNFAVAE